jgi:hypothetical protein
MSPLMRYHSVALGGPFAQCTSCESPLAALRTGYQLVKCWRGGDVAYEYALCQGCQAQLVASFSEDSRRHLAEVHQKHFRAGSALQRCAFCDAPGEDVLRADYNLTGLFLAAELQEEVLCCRPCADAMQAGLSAHTRQVWDRFLDERMAPPPPDTRVPEPVLR